MNICSLCYIACLGKCACARVCMIISFLGHRLGLKACVRVCVYVQGECLFQALPLVAPAAHTSVCSLCDR